MNFHSAEINIIVEQTLESELFAIETFNKNHQDGSTNERMGIS